MQLKAYCFNLSVLEKETGGTSIYFRIEWETIEILHVWTPMKSFKGLLYKTYKKILMTLA